MTRQDVSRCEEFGAWVLAALIVAVFSFVAWPPEPENPTAVMAAKECK